MFNSAQRTFILDTFNFNSQQRLNNFDFNNQQRASIVNDIDNNINIKTKIKVNKSDLYYENRMTLED